MRDLIIIGAGGFGRETIDVVRAINESTPTWTLLGVLDDSPSRTNLDRLEALGVPHLGALSEIPAGANVAVAVGSPAARGAIVASLPDRGHTFPALIHPSAITGSRLRHGDGLIALGGVSIGTNVTLGNHVHVNAHAVLGHDTHCGDFVSINPNATVSGECTIEAGSLVGAACTILQGVVVARSVVVGAGAVVVRNTPEGKVVKGVPAR